MINRVILRNFKRFKEVDFRIPSHIVLAGPNNTGKTTLLQAIAAWDMGLKRWKELNDFNSRKGGYVFAPIARQAFSAVALRSFDLLWLDRTTRRPIVIEVQIDSLPPVAMEFHFDTTEQVKVRPSLETRADVLAQVASSTVFIPAMSGLQPNEALFGRQETLNELLAQSRPGEILRNLLVHASQDDPAWRNLNDIIKRLFHVELITPTVGAFIVAEYHSIGSAHRLDIANAGSGFQQVLMLLTLLLSRPASVLLLDEPDAHLHVILQDVIYTELRRIAAESGSQLIIATHSEVMIDSVDPRELCLMYGKPKLMADNDEKKRLIDSLSGLSHADIMLSESAKGVLYVEDYTDIEILRAFARILDHPAYPLLTDEIMWKKAMAPLPEGLGGFTSQQHWQMLRLVCSDLRALEILDGDSKNKADESITGTADRMQRLRWQYYEIESYLMFPAALTRFIESKLGAGPASEPAITAMLEELRRTMDQEFLDDPYHPKMLVETYLKAKKVSESLLPALLQAAGLHNFPKNRFSEIAAQFKPEEIHPEIIEKLDKIKQAFGV
jgi:ABC-type transport system involved in cytochrome c biogenesis ATPase subunit